MHRVELKALSTHLSQILHAQVPNAPCGVESKLLGVKETYSVKFLMHRVELKVRRRCHEKAGDGV